MDDPWLEAVAAVRAELDGETRDDAVEVFLAEAARCRLVDRRGPTRVTLRCGTVLSGELVGSDESIAGVLDLRDACGQRVLIPAAAVLRMVGTQAGLRPESGAPRERSLMSVLRECWSAGDRLRALASDGCWIDGTVRSVASDHVVMASGADVVVLPLDAVEAWQVS